MQRFVDNFEAIPVVVLCCLLRDREPYVYETASIYPACQNLLLAARALGFGANLSTWHAGVEQELRTLLEIPDEVWMAATMTIGRPAGRHGPLRRKPLEDVVFDGRWGRHPVWLTAASHEPFPSALGYPGA
jgi:nitroreductase